MTVSTALEILSGILATQGGITGAFTAGVVHSRLMGYRDQISAKLASFYDFGAEFFENSSLISEATTEIGGSRSVISLDGLKCRHEGGVQVRVSFHFKTLMQSYKIMKFKRVSILYSKVNYRKKWSLNKL